MKKYSQFINFPIYLWASRTETVEEAADDDADADKDADEDAQVSLWGGDMRFAPLGPFFFYMVFDNIRF